MGGYNSGRHTSRPAVEDGLTLDLARLMRQGLAVRGARHGGSIVWTTGAGERRATISYDADLTDDDIGLLRLDYTVGGKPQAYAVRLVTTPCHFGGRRWWFLCPLSGRRCGKLYLPPGGTIFGARRAYRLAYRSQREDAMGRSHALQRRLYSRLGGEYRCFEDPYPSRPKWMRRATYERKAAKIESAIERHETIFLAGAERFMARLG